MRVGVFSARRQERRRTPREGSVCILPLVTERVLHVELWIPRPRAEVFSFFADPRNLALITPPWLSFHVLTPEPIAMRRGALIDYKLRVRGIPIRWQSELTAWEPPVRFVDEQR